MFDEANLNLQIALVLVLGLVLGSIPAMLFISFYGGRQVEKQRKVLQLRYEHQVSTLKNTLRHLMERIDELTKERNSLRRANKGLREAIRDQHRLSDESGLQLERANRDLAYLQGRIEQLNNEKARYEGRLEQARANQERLETHFQRAIAQFTEVNRLKRNLLFAANELRAMRGRPKESGVPATENTDAFLDVSILEGLDPAQAAKLHDSGIHTIGELARQTPDRVAQFAGLADPAVTAAWIAEARARLGTPNRAQA